MEQTSHVPRSDSLQVGIERERLLDPERDARAHAERATQLRDEMLALVAHDLRNPLHTIASSLRGNTAFHFTVPYARA